MWITPTTLIFIGFQTPQTTQKKSPNYKVLNYLYYIYLSTKTIKMYSNDLYIKRLSAKKYKI